jgi:hypothetical protein
LQNKVIAPTLIKIWEIKMIELMKNKSRFTFLISSSKGNILFKDLRIQTNLYANI